jgi:hypothetical protein
LICLLLQAVAVAAVDTTLALKAEAVVQVDTV